MYEHIKKLMVMFPGKEKMIIYCDREKKRIGTRCIIHHALVEELEEIAGEGNVVVK